MGVGVKPHWGAALPGFLGAPHPSAAIAWSLLAVLLLLVATPLHAACENFPVALDIGHSLARPGATSARGRPEFAFNRDLVIRLADALADSGLPAVLVNAEGADLGLAERGQRAAAEGAAVLLSVHHDSVQPRYLAAWTPEGIPRHHSEHARGFSLFVSRENPHPGASERLARLLGAHLGAAGFTPSLHHAEPIPGEGRTLLDAAGGVYRFDGLGVLRHAPMPAVLLEAGVIVHREEEQQLRDPEYQVRMAGAIVAALLEYCGAL